MNKSYYAIIPADVRYDVRLTPNAKLLYGEITALCNEKGYCWAMNEYFASLYSVSKKSVSEWFRSLRECGYIEVKFQYRDGTKQISNRYVRIATPHEENFHTLPTKTSIPSPRKLPYPPHEKVKDNNTTNITVNNTLNMGETSFPDLPEPIPPGLPAKKGVRFIKPELAEVTEYCNENSYTIAPQSFIDFYESKGWMIGKNKMKSWQAACRTWQNNDNKRNAQNAGRKNANEKRAEYASEIRDYGKAMRNF